MTLEELYHKLDRTKDDVLNNVLKIVAILIVIGLGISLLRYKNTGFQTIYLIHCFLSISTVLLLLFQKYFKPNVRGGIFIFSLYVMVYSGILSLGLHGFGYIYFIPAVFLGFVYFKPRNNFIVIGVNIIIVAAIWYFYIQGGYSYLPEEVDYMDHLPVWLNMMITISLVVTIISMFWTKIYALFIRNSAEVELQKDKISAMNRVLQEAKEEVELSDRLKSKFLANMSHEIRTPLNHIIGCANLIDETKDEDEKQYFKNELTGGCNRVLNMVDDIIFFSKLDADGLRLSIQPTTLSVVQQHLLQSIEVPQEIDFQFHRSNAELQLQWDLDRSVQLLQHVVSNAIKFTREGKVCVDCEVEQGLLVYTIEDNGIGIDPIIENRIFDRFYKGNQFYDGAGLGLSVVKEILTKIGGRITYTSEVNKGTCFTLHIPLDWQSQDQFQEVG